MDRIEQPYVLALANGEFWANLYRTAASNIACTYTWELALAAKWATEREARAVHAALITALPKSNLKVKRVVPSNAYVLEDV